MSKYQDNHIIALNETPKSIMLKSLSPKRKLHTETDHDLNYQQRRERIGPETSTPLIPRKQLETFQPDKVPRKAKIHKSEMEHANHKFVLLSPIEPEELSDLGYTAEEFEEHFMSVEELNAGRD